MRNQFKQFERSHFISKGKWPVQDYEVEWTSGGNRHRAVRSTHREATEVGRAKIRAGAVDVRLRRVGTQLWQGIPKRKKNKKAASRPGQDALDRRLPGSFESGKRR